MLADYADLLFGFESLVFLQDHTLPSDKFTTTQETFRKVFANTAKVREIDPTHTPKQVTISPGELHSQMLQDLTRENIEQADLQVRPLQILDMVE